MKKHPPVRILIPFVIIVAIGVYLARQSLHRREAVPDGAIAANGTIEATEIDIAPKVAGRIVEMTVEEGDPVKAGQVVAVLEGEDLAAQVDQAQGAYDAARARLEDLLRGTRPEQIRQAQAALSQAEAAAEGALSILQIVRESYAKSTELRAQYVNARAAYTAARSAARQARARRALVDAGARREQIEQARAAAEQARAQSENALAEAARAETLYASGAISGQGRDAAIARRDAAEAALAAAQARLEELRAGSRPEEKEQARAAESQAQAQLEGARQNLRAIEQLYNDRLAARQQMQAARTQYATASRQVAAARAQLDLLVAGPTRQTIDAARGQAEQAAGALKAARAMAGNLIVESPSGGTVLLKSAEAGEVVTAGAPIVRIADLSTVWVRVYIPATRLNVKVGDRAEVVTDAYPARYPGQVVEIADKPEFTPKNVQTKEERVKLVFGVKVLMDNPRRELKPGMPADAYLYPSAAPQED
ncbi:MAG: HlyD family efflux transporter periplasmic adaptor subunit [Armatimonadetes bacterium]|nr:HlyD family efflux transporter periplasmic adaptor subunit [Armatimonadota bacterium]